MINILSIFLKTKERTMKRIVASIMFISSSLMLSAQGFVPSPEDVSAFFTTKTLVVLEENPLLEYNSIIKKVMQQEWNITEFDFITDKEFEEKRMDAQYSFIYMSRVTFEGTRRMQPIGSSIYRLAEITSV